MRKPDIKRLLDLQQLTIIFGNIERHIDLNDGTKKETDVDHSYTLAMAAWFLAPHFPKLDRDLLIRFALAHDLVEVHAGDTYIYADEATRSSKQEREANALRRLAAEWPDFPELIATMHDYEIRESAEAKFIYALDKIMPMIAIYLGQGYSWHLENVPLSQLHEAKRDKVKVSPDIAPYYDELYELLVAHPEYFPKEKNASSEAA